MKKILTTIGVMTGFLLPSLVFAQMMYWDGSDRGFHMSGFWPWMGGAMFLGLVIWILIIVGIIYLIKWLVAGSHKESGKKDSAIEILKERYARGEIKKEEFDEKLKDLTK